MAKRDAGREHITRLQYRDMVAADVPPRDEHGRHQSAGPHSAGLQRREAEDLAGVSPVEPPVIHHQQPFGADDPSQDRENAEIPRLVGIHAMAGGVAHADGEPDQQAHGGQKSVSRKGETAEVQQDGKHWFS